MAAIRGTFFGSTAAARFGRPAYVGLRQPHDGPATSAKAHTSRKARPHGLRHGGITRALEVSGGDVRAVQRLSRHAKLEMLMRYDDNRRDDAGSLAQRLADADDAI